MGQLRILVVDDDPVITGGLSQILSAKNFSVDTTSTGWQAINFLIEKRFDVIILDNKLPDVTGIELIKCIKTNVLNRRTPIYFLTGTLEKKVSEKMLKVGGVEVFRKPEGIETLVRKIDQEISIRTRPVAYTHEIIDLFRRAGHETLEFYCEGGGVVVEQPILRQTSGNVLDVVSTILLFGDTVYGSLSLSFGHSFLKKFAEKLFMADDMDIDGELLADLSGELTNQTAGKVKEKCYQVGAYLNIGLPTLRIKDKTFPHYLPNPNVTLPFLFEGEKILLDFCLGEPIDIKSGAPQMPIFVYDKQSSAA